MNMNEKQKKRDYGKLFRKEKPKPILVTDLLKKYKKELKD